MSARFEIVRTDAGWHSRFRAKNGRVVWTTEVYARRPRALKAIGVLVDAFGDGWIASWYYFDRRSVGEAIIYRSSHWEKTNALRTEIRDVDERSAVTK